MRALSSLIRLSPRCLPLPLLPLSVCFSRFPPSRAFVSDPANARTNTTSNHDGNTRPRSKVTCVSLSKYRSTGKPITMVSAYNYSSALHVEAAGIDVLLVGDSLAMVEMGHKNTLQVDMADMTRHAQAVARGAVSPLLVGDMPFGSYENGKHKAYENALIMIKQGGMDAVKLEGGSEEIACTVSHLVSGGIPVMGHIGLTPQRVSIMGGFKAQGRTVDAARQIIEQARRLEKAGCFAIVIECVPSVVAAAVTQSVRIPTIGIGAGPHTSGQVLVFNDLLAVSKDTPPFSKRFAEVGQAIQSGLRAYKEQVENGSFPSREYSPYALTNKEAELFHGPFAEEMAKQGIFIKDDRQDKPAQQTIVDQAQQSDTSSIKLY